ncbi:unnamed protein product [Peniophora sp. CBMAI 1063]|nr:unnamed protein product [Peniophora sp. CBMAI 1063]
MPREVLGGSWCDHGARAQHDIRSRTPRPPMVFAYWASTPLVVRRHFNGFLVQCEACGLTMALIVSRTQILLIRRRESGPNDRLARLVRPHRRSIQGHPLQLQYHS